MAIQADENRAEGVPCDVKGALDAARMALQSFFHFWEYLRIDASVWWVFQHRAFEEAVSTPASSMSSWEMTDFPISSLWYASWVNKRNHSHLAITECLPLPTSFSLWQKTMQGSVLRSWTS
jgi:hypothetical protein